MKAISSATSRRALTWWFGLMLLGGLAFGFNSDRRPFGSDMLAHPLIVFFALVAAGLLLLRAALRRPVPEVLPERMLVAGCAIGIIAYLAGNWLAAKFLQVAMLTPHQG